MTIKLLKTLFVIILLSLSFFHASAILDEYEYDWGYNKGEEVIVDNVVYAINIEARTAGVRHFYEKEYVYPNAVYNVPSYMTYYGIDYKVNSFPDSALIFKKNHGADLLTIPATIKRFKLDWSKISEYSREQSFGEVIILDSKEPMEYFGHGHDIIYSTGSFFSGFPARYIGRAYIGRDGNYYFGTCVHQIDPRGEYPDLWKGYCTIYRLNIGPLTSNVKVNVAYNERESGGEIEETIVEYSPIPLDSLEIDCKYRSELTVDRDIKYLKGNFILSVLSERFDTLPSWFDDVEKTSPFTFKSPNIKLTREDVKGLGRFSIPEENTSCDFCLYNWAVYNLDRDSLLWAYPCEGEDGFFHFAPELKTIQEGTIKSGTANIFFHDGITEIADRVFKDYRVNFKGSQTIFKRIGNNAFSYKYETEDYSLDEGSTAEFMAIEEIGDSAFYGRKDVTTFILGPNVKKIGKHAFGKKMSKYEKPKFPAWEEYIPPVYRICILADEVPECGEIFSRDMFYDEEQADKWHYRNFEFYVPAHMVEKYRNCDQDFRNYPIYDIAQYNDPAGIDEVTDYAPEAEPQYYNLTGTQITNPTPGHLYIVKRGNQVTKELFQNL